ncbi:alpha/beta hydrolase [Pseudoalteromonas aurantia]|uniref:Alpha/beta hydrolase n=3 Tax=Pseudoalteromonas TaxID=53246 RepID=A0A5S3V4A1_9GAMM|nr:alpha/beta hydrolase-fold protein [Pseudoalteromonas aurantia]TMO58992.1 hypothetical protein CWC18_16665 [Pseudoalteromonas aurantia]TMO65919.1 hypothetical protein CWC19_16990 [Pseudoalteromonas aurantia]TMO78045.1 hypothetical protein CWC20_02545 [Pseudoalteromonas aurantia]
MQFNLSRPYILISLLILISCALFTLYFKYQQAYTSPYIDITLDSKVLSESRKIFIRLPNNYDDTKSYPLIIKSDGNFNLTRWDNVITDLSNRQKMQDSILVSIPNQFWQNTRNRDLVPPFARQDVSIEARPVTDNDPAIFGQANLFLSFIETELLPYLESNYAVNNNRVLSGFSAGGSFVLYTMITKPELFSGYFAFSPAAWYDDSVVVKEFTQHIANIHGSPKYLFLSLGGLENEIITGSFKGLLLALEQRAPNNITWEYSYSAGVGHSENPYISVPPALEGYYKTMLNF